ncbi:dihydrolipoamide acetyltransferase family protein [Actinacidiphila oryziradicis]|uniref:Dihydrolipoamide acetyltransferase component of pyruvate dehydrogenase complex n=1 Tax=Actinacidiphila oryziradicis TaxID=2571141 RepID=A0A4V5MZH4_9ACTN|nr:dihydrolipoamide acetyltransferase family protein [Actinacidiphila oryziradicis]TKA08219.1 2-oxo acid dehydrogenase subunit E2 [Actinacidiphila oryziradicis]
MTTLLRVPEVAAGATQAVLSEWLVKENTPYKTGDPIVVLETDKALVEVAAESDAVILRALVPNGSTVEVGAPIALLGDESETGADVEQLLAELGVSARPADREQKSATPSEASPNAQVAPPVTTESESARVFISPLARRILKEAGLTTDQVRGTGPHGRIVRRDVERAVEESRAVAVPAGPVPAGPVPAEPVRPASPRPQIVGFRDIPHTRMRRAVASRLTASKQTVPHFYVKRTARIDDLLALRKQLNEVSPQKISVNDLVIAAVAVAHQAVPDANVIWTDEGMRQFESADVAVAIASERGLVTPVLCAVERMSPSAIAREVKTYVRKANEGTLQQGDLEGGSLTVTNLGMYGVDEFSAIINPPHSAILAVGAGRPAPVVVDGTVEVATQMTLVLSVDHRAIDGALAAQWMEALVGALEQPLRLVA